MTTPSVSVVLAVWNGIDTIERAVGSALATHDPALQVVVVDDASSDGTAEWLHARAQSDARIEVVALPANVGVSEARNAGLAAARGTWVTFLDADDRLLDGWLDRVLDASQDADVRVVIGQKVWWDGERHWVSPLYDRPDITAPGRKSVATHPGLLYSVAVTGKVFHRSLLEDLRFHGRVLGDQPWAIRAMLRAGDGIEVLGETMYEWWRPRPADGKSTITSLTRASAARSAASARIARQAFVEVSDEARRCVTDEVVRDRVLRTYAERLLRSDFSKSLMAAVGHRDPDVPDFIKSLTELVSSWPAVVLRPPDVVIDAVLRPLWRRWPHLPLEGRRATLELLSEVRRSDADVARRMIGSARLVPALDAATRLWAVHDRAGDIAVRAVRVLIHRLRRRAAPDRVHDRP